MKIDYTTSEQDYRAYAKFIQKRLARLARSSFGWPVLVGGWIFLVLTFFLAFRASQNSVVIEYLPVQPDVALVVFIALVFLGCFAFYYVKLSANMMRSLLSPNSPLLGNFCIELDDAGFTVRGKSIQTRYSWDAARFVEEDSDHIYILVDNGAGFPIPKAAFSSADRMRDFLDRFSARID